MSKPSRLSQRDVSNVAHVVADIAAQAADVSAQRQLLVDSMQSMVDASIGFTYVAEGWLPGLRQTMLSSVVSSSMSPYFESYIEEVIFPKTVKADPFCAETVNRRDRVVHVSRQDVMPDLPAERKYDVFRDWASRCKLGDGAVCFTRMNGDRGAIFGVGLHRVDGGHRPFSPRERAKVSLAIAQCGELIERGSLPVPELTDDAREGMADLPERARKVLELIVAGEAATTIASQLGFSVFVAHQYGDLLCRHFDAENVDELIAKFVP